MKQVYPSDLTDGQWQNVARLIPPAKPGGRPREADMRAVLNAIFYIARGGWFNRYRRLSKGYAFCVDTSEAMIYVAMTHLMLRRLRPAATP